MDNTRLNSTYENILYQSGTLNKSRLPIQSQGDLWTRLAITNGNAPANFCGHLIRFFENRGFYLDEMKRYTERIHGESKNQRVEELIHATVWHQSCEDINRLDQLIDNQAKRVKHLPDE